MSSGCTSTKVGLCQSTQNFKPFGNIEWTRPANILHAWFTTIQVRLHLIPASLVKQCFIRCRLKSCLCNNALCHHHPGLANHAGLTTYAKPSSFWTYHLYVSGPQTHMDSRGHFYGCTFTLGQTFWPACQELASRQDFFGKNCESKPMRHPSNKRERKLGNGCRRELERWFGIFTHKSHRGLGHQKWRSGGELYDKDHIYANRVCS